MDIDASSPPTSRRSSGNRPSLLIHLKLPPQALQNATTETSSVNDDLPPLPSLDTKPTAAPSPFPPSSPPTMASSPAPGAIIKRRGGPKRKNPGLAPGAGVFSLSHEGTGSGAGTPAPSGPATGEKERLKPGPKANPGGINAGLRALDRSGKRTRRWQKVSYPVHTCSGYKFYTTTWISPVPGDGLYEKGMAKEAEDGLGGREAGHVEQDTAMADASSVVA